MRNTNRKARRIPPVRFTLADRLLATGQRLRADETMTARTITVRFAAQWAQAGGR